MACFLVPTAEAIVTTVITKVAEKKAVKEVKEVKEVKIEGNFDRAEVSMPTHKNSFVRKLKWLNYMLWGGAALLAFEHVWHGEVTPWFPFLTAASNSADTTTMLHELATSGVAMAVLVTVVWIGMVVVTGTIEKRTLKENVTTD